MVGTIGIAGITGKFGRSVARHLLATNPELSLRGYCRNPAKLPSTLSSSSRVTIHQGNSDDPAAVRGFVKGCDVVICSYLGDNTLMTDGQRVLIDACEAEKVKRYVASDYSLDFTKLEYGQLFVKDPMKRVKEYLETKHHVRGVHVLIGVFMETFWSRFFGVWNGRENKLRFWGDGDEKWESTTYDNAAQYVAAVALDESAVGVQKFLGDRKSIREIADVFESVYQTKPQLENAGSLADLYKNMHEIREKNPSAFFSYIPLFYQYYCTNGQTHLGEKTDNSKYPSIKPVTFEDFLKSHKLEELGSASQAVGSNL